MRVFVALDIPDEVRRKISEFRAGLEAVCPQARWARVDGMHVTLKFIGEVPPPKVEQINAALAAIRSAARVEMNFRGAGYFPDERHARVFWIGIAGTANLGELAAAIEQRLEPLGIAREQRAFHPHLTLARFKSREGLEQLREAVKAYGALEFGATRAAELYLYQSKLERGGAEYTRIATLPFVGDAR